MSISALNKALADATILSNHCTLEGDIMLSIGGDCAGKGLQGGLDKHVECSGVLRGEVQAVAGRGASTPTAGGLGGFGTVAAHVPSLATVVTSHVLAASLGAIPLELGLELLDLSL
jgi:hypothetical protein